MENLGRIYGEFMAGMLELLKNANAKQRIRFCA
jgi:hypothetical protein